MKFITYLRSRFVAVIAALALCLGFVVTTASAQSAPTFDYTVYSALMSSGAGVVATTATLMAGILAGVLIWRKIAKYFNKGG